MTMKKGANNTYFGNLWEGISSLTKGLGLTLKHFFNANKSRKPIGIEDKDYFLQDKGIVTLEYPHEAIPIPDNGRYRLHNEIEDCIVCDLCAKICPVNCIEIDVVKATEEIGKTSDGTTKRLYAATFDIDMAKCCYCGLCTTVCPTECLTMTKTYDYSEFDVRNMVYHFSNLTPEQGVEKKRLFEEQQKQKAAAKPAVEKPAVKAAEPSAEVKEETKEASEVKKLAFKPVIKAKPVEKKEEAAPKEETENKEGSALPSSEQTKEAPQAAVPAAKKPVFKPVIKAKPAEPKIEEPTPEKEEEKPEAKATATDSNVAEEKKEETPTVKKPFKPVIKPIMKPKPKPDTDADQNKE